jgi:hypothetical protein
LDIVKHFEECDANEDILDPVIAIPPKGNAAYEKGYFYRTGATG